VVRLAGGLVFVAWGVALMLLARLGVDPWTVLHQGISHDTGIPIGQVSIIVGAAVLVLWWPLRQRPGVGTLINTVAIGLLLDATLSALPTPHGLAPRWAALVGGIVVMGIGAGLYIGAGLGPGPRDGLMTGLAARGHSLRVVRTVLELSVLGVGWLLGGDIGMGTLVFAFGIGPVVHVTIPLFAMGPAPDTHRPELP